MKRQQAGRGSLLSCGLLLWGSLALSLNAEADAPTAGLRLSAQESEAQTESQVEEKPSVDLSFIAEEQARVRAALSPDEVDMDARVFIDTEISEASGHFSLSGALGLWADLDGVPPADQPTVFAEVHDPRAFPLWVDVYALQARYQSHGLLHSARAGRIVVDHGLPRSVDGLELEFNVIEHWLDVFAYGGRSVHFFETEAAMFEDWVGAVGVASRPLHNLRIECEALIQREDTDNKQGLTEAGYGAKAWYRQSDWMDLRAYVRGIDTALSHAGGALRLRWQPWGVGTELRVRSQLIALEEQSEFEDPYYSTLGSSEAFVRGRWDIWKELGSDWGDYALHLGVDGRQLLGGEVSTFNRNFAYAYAELVGQDVVVKGPFARLALERQAVDMDFSGQGYWTMSGSAGYAKGSFKAELGSRYDAYKYTYYQSVDEFQDVQSYFASLQYKPAGQFSIRARYLYEHFAWDVHTFSLSLVQVF